MQAHVDDDLLTLESYIKHGMKKHTKKEEKEMFRKELMKAGLIVAISILSLVGCSGEEEPKPSETTSVEASTDEQSTQKETQAETQEPTDEQTTGDVGVGKFDPADVCKNISIDGRIVEFPWTLNKLGDEYEFDSVTNDNLDDGISAASMSYNGKLMFVVALGDDKADRDSPIVVMSFAPSDNVAVYGLGKGTTVEEVVKVLGEPNEVNEYELMGHHYTYLSDEMRLCFTFYNGKLSETYISVH